MSKRYFLFSILLSSLISSMIVCCVFLFFFNNDKKQHTYNAIGERQKQFRLTGYSDSSFTVPEGLNFIHAAEKVIPGVVHIRSFTHTVSYSFNPMQNLLGEKTLSSGSGVIISDDGYIVTNNHVISRKDQIEVILNNNRTYEAVVIGVDPTTDLALIKIDASNLNFVTYGNSDLVKAGEWVLAIGNPFDLNSTVTAGIVSAKARNIGILKDENNLQIESFIQTDAAVNPGNSGGALVNLRGELIGINTAIATSTGTYTGYSFAVPVTLVQKVMDDLMVYGEVKRALLGIRITDVNARLVDSKRLKVYTGVYVNAVNRKSAADQAGIQSGDVIIAISGIPVNNVSELQELVARNRPGDKITVTYIRGDDTISIEAILRNEDGNL